MTRAVSQGSAVKANPPPRGRRARRSGPDAWRRGLDVFARVVAAVGMGYVAAALTTAALARLLPGPVEEATIGATTFSFVVYAAVAIWAFADAKAWRVWTGLLAFSAVLGAVLWWSLRVEPRL